MPRVLDGDLEDVLGDLSDSHLTTGRKVGEDGSLDAGGGEKPCSVSSDKRIRVPWLL